MIQRDPSPRVLSVTSGPMAGARFLLEGTMEIGRSGECAIVVKDAQVSQVHARIDELPGGGHELVDLHSQNGTIVAGRRIRRILLEPGMTVLVGGTELQYRTCAEGEVEAEPVEQRCDDWDSVFATQPRLVLLGSEQGAEPEAGASLASVFEDILEYRTLRYRRLRGGLHGGDARRLARLGRALCAGGRHARPQCSASGSLTLSDGTTLRCEVTRLGVEGASVRVEAGELSDGIVVWMSVDGSGHAPQRIPAKVRVAGDGGVELTFVGEAQSRSGRYVRERSERRDGVVLARVEVRVR